MFGKNNLFKIYTKSLFFDVDTKTILILYQIITSPYAINLYLLLLNLANMFKTTDSNEFLKFSLLLKILNISEENLVLARKQLESVNLIKTYLNEEDNIDYYCIVICPPLTPNSFFENSLLSKIFLNKLNNAELAKVIKNFFIIPLVPSISGKNISVSYDKFLSLNFEVNKQISNAFNKEKFFSRKKKKDIILGNEFITHLNISNNVIFNEKDINYVSELYYVYNLPWEEISNLIMKNLNKNNTINFSNLIINSNKAISFFLKKTKPKITKMLEQNQNIKKAIKNMSSLNITEFYFYVYKKPPTKHILQQLSLLMKKYSLNYSIINCLLDYSYLKNKKLVLPYIEKIALTCYNEELFDLYDVISHLFKIVGKNIKKDNENKLNKDYKKINQIVF